MTEMRRSNSQEAKLCEGNLNPSGTETPDTSNESGVGAPGSGPSYHNWREVYPELQLLIDEYETILEEAKTISTVRVCFVYEMP